MHLELECQTLTQLRKVRATTTGLVDELNRHQNLRPIRAQLNSLVTKAMSAKGNDLAAKLYGQLQTETQSARCIRI